MSISVLWILKVHSGIDRWSWIGANPSAEEGEEALDDGSTQVNNVVHSFRLQSTAFDKKTYLTYLKGYMKAVKAKLQEKNPDRVAAFETGAAAFAKKIVAGFKDYEFYTGEGMNPEGMVALLNYRVSQNCMPILTGKTDRAVPDCFPAYQEDGVTRMHPLPNQIDLN